MSLLRVILAFGLFLAVAANAKNAPSFRGELLSGGKTSLDSLLKKDRILLLSFWATWCLPCLDELTHVNDRLKKDPKLPIDLVSVNIDREQRSEIPATMRQMGFDFPVILDPNAEIFGKYQKATTLPFSVLIFPDKTIDSEFNGYHESMLQKLEQAAAKLKPGKI